MGDCDSGRIALLESANTRLVAEVARLQAEARREAKAVSAGDTALLARVTQAEAALDSANLRLEAREQTLREFARRAEAWHADVNSSSGQLIDLANDIIDAAETLATKEQA